MTVSTDMRMLITAKDWNIRYVLSLIVCYLNNTLDIAMHSATNLSYLLHSKDYQLNSFSRKSCLDVFQTVVTIMNINE